MKSSYGQILLLLALLLTGCDRLGLEDPAAELAREEAEGKAIGSACRQTGRALEDCYQANRRSPKAAIFAGWRDMDGYMRENKIEEIKPESADKPVAAKSRPLESVQAVIEAAQPSPPQNSAPAANSEKAPAAKAVESAPPAARRSPLSR